jgi:hypothetical protein
MAVSDDGSTIVGHGRNPSNHTEAWVARLDARKVATGICLPEVIPVAIFTTEDFNAADVNEATVKLPGASPFRCVLTDVDEDGDDDLVCEFQRKDIDQAGGGGVATLIGRTTDGALFTGDDGMKVLERNCVRQRGKGD